AAGTLTHVQVRRNVIADAYRVLNTADYSQGLFVSRVATLLVEENVIDHNGWNATVAGTTSEHNHNVYLQVDNTDITVRGNISAHHTDGTANTRAYLFDTNLENVSFHNNIAYDWVRTTDNGGQSLKFDTASTRTGLAVRDNDFQQPVHGQLVEHVVSPGSAF